MRYILLCNHCYYIYFLWWYKNHTQVVNSDHNTAWDNCISSFINTAFMIRWNMFHGLIIK